MNECDIPEIREVLTQVLDRNLTFEMKAAYTALYAGLLKKHGLVQSARDKRRETLRRKRLAKVLFG